MADNGDEAGETANASSRGFNPWLIVIPAVAVLTIAVVLLFGARILDPTSIHESLGVGHIAIGGLVVLLILLIVEVVLLMGGHPENLEDEDEPAPGPDTPAARDDVSGAAAAVGAEGQFEALATDDRLEGRDVLEMARPPKTDVDAGVYATTYVQVDTSRVLRLEEIVARRQ